MVRYPDLPGCITVGDTMNDALANAEDAKRAWIAAAIEDGLEIAEPDSPDNYSGQFKLRIPKSLHRSLAEHAKAGGSISSRLKVSLSLFTCPAAEAYGSRRMYHCVSTDVPTTRLTRRTPSISLSLSTVSTGIGDDRSISVYS